MRSFKIPYTLDREEKIFGGYVSMRQAGYLALAVMGIGLFFVMPLFLAIPLFVVNLVLMIAFAFANYQDIRFDRYSMYLLKYLMRERFYIYRR